MEEVFSYIEAHTEEFLEDLKRVCRQPSVSAQDRGIGACAKLVRDMMEEAGLRSCLMPVEGGAPVVLGELVEGEGKRTLGFYNHYDVQPPEPLELWHSPPFDPRARGGRIYARGVSDNKGNIISRLKAAESILETLGEVPVNLKFFIEGEEEIGSPHISKFVKENRELLQADAYIWESGNKDPSDRPEISLGVKGILYVELISEGANTDLHSGKWANLVLNPAWRLVWALNSLKGEEERILIDGFYEGVQEPTGEELDVLERIPLDEERIKRMLGISGYLRGLKGIEALRTQFFEPSCNICGLDSGYQAEGAKTVLPNQAKAKIDFRLVGNQDPDEIFQKLKKHLIEGGFRCIKLERMGSYPAAKTQPTERIVNVASNTAREVYGREPILTWSAGSSPIYTVRDYLGVPVVSAGLDYFHSNNHAPNENIRIREDFVQGIKHMAAIILYFGSLEY